MLGSQLARGARLPALPNILGSISKEDVQNFFEDLAKKLKSKFACGGTGKAGRVELQGDHRSRIKEALIAIGFPSETINIK